MCPEGVAQRVNLGLLPSSEAGWLVGCKALDHSTGGILHIHGNVESAVRQNNGEKEFNEFCQLSLSECESAYVNQDSVPTLTSSCCNQNDTVKCNQQLASPDHDFNNCQDVTSPDHGLHCSKSDLQAIIMQTNNVSR